MLQTSDSSGEWLLVVNANTISLVDAKHEVSTLIDIVCLCILTNSECSTCSLGGQGHKMVDGNGILIVSVMIVCRIPGEK